MKYSIAKYAVSALVAGIVLGGGVAYADNIARATEGEQMVFKVTLPDRTHWSVRYRYSTSDGWAVKGTDYQATTGTVTFPVGVKTQKIIVNTLDDSVSESLEDFQLKLYDQEVNGLYRDVTGWVPTDPSLMAQGVPLTMTLTGYIRDNDSRPKNCSYSWGCQAQ